MADSQGSPPAVPALDFVADADPTKVQKPFDPKAAPPPESPAPEKPFDPGPMRELARGDLARGLLWLLGFTVAGVLVFIALGRVDGSALTQSIFPSLIALAGTALGFYFGGTQTGGGSSPPPPQGH